MGAIPVHSPWPSHECCPCRQRGCTQHQQLDRRPAQRCTMVTNPCETGVLIGTIDPIEAATACYVVYGTLDAKEDGLQTVPHQSSSRKEQSYEPHLALVCAVKLRHLLCRQVAPSRSVHATQARCTADSSLAKDDEREWRTFGIFGNGGGAEDLAAPIKVSRKNPPSSCNPQIQTPPMMRVVHVLAIELPKLCNNCIRGFRTLPAAAKLARHRLNATKPE